jgi:hypothetical protein
MKKFLSNFGETVVPKEQLKSIRGGSGFALIEECTGCDRGSCTGGCTSGGDTCGWVNGACKCTYIAGGA